jgi:hypothetical protein
MLELGRYSPGCHRVLLTVGELWLFWLRVALGAAQIA